MSLFAAYSADWLKNEYLDSYLEFMNLYEYSGVQEFTFTINSHMLHILFASKAHFGNHLCWDGCQTFVQPIDGSIQDLGEQIGWKTPTLGKAAYFFLRISEEWCSMLSSKSKSRFHSTTSESDSRSSKSCVLREDIWTWENFHLYANLQEKDTFSKALMTSKQLDLQLLWC